MTIEDYFPSVDFNKVVQLCPVHDLGEAYEGDVSATIEANREEKLKREENAVNKLCASLPEKIRNRFLTMWWEYNKGETPEAKLATLTGHLINGTDILIPIPRIINTKG